MDTCVPQIIRIEQDGRRCDTLELPQDIDALVPDTPLIDQETPMSNLRAEYESQDPSSAFLEQIDWLINKGCDYVRRTKGTLEFAVENFKFICAGRGLWNKFQFSQMMATVCTDVSLQSLPSHTCYLPNFEYFNQP